MKISKKLLSLLLCAVMVLGSVAVGGEGFADVLDVFSVKASAISEADFQNKISQLQNTFKNGEYWNYYSASDYSHSGNIPCPCGSAYCNNDACKCGYFSGGYQCYGYANKLANEIFGKYKGNGYSVRYDVGTIYAGDIIRFGSSDTIGHSIFVYKVSGNTIYFTDCNYSGPCKIRWGVTLSGLNNNTYYAGFKFLYVAHLDGNTVTGNGHTHSYNNSASIIKAPTSSSTGTRRCYCSCGGYIDETIPAIKYTTIKDGIYSVKSKLSSTLMTSGWSSSINTNVYIYQSGASTPTVDQQWEFRQNSDGTYTITCMLNKLALDVEGGSKVNYANIQLYTPNGSDSQKYYLVSDGSGYFKLIPKISYLAVDVSGGYTTDGTNIQQYADNGSNAQKWALQLIEAYDTSKPKASISSTNYVDSSQTVTLSMSDDTGLAGYYWGTNSSYSSNTYTAISGTSKSVTKTVSSSGTYYLTVKDTSGNISSTVSKTFYKTTLNANGGSVSPSSVITMSGNSFTLPTPTRSGYSFKNWNTVSGGTGTSYTGSYKPTGNVTLYAQWTANTYTVSFNANGGSGAPSNQTKTYGTALTLSSTKPTRTGYTFKNWNTKSDGTGTSYSAGGSYTENAAVTLYAQWTVNDTTNPTGSITSTNNITASQTVTLSLNDNVGLMGYYWGTSADFFENDFYRVSGASQTVTMTISSPGTYYLTVQDSASNFSADYSKTFYQTTLDANGGSVSPASVITMSGNSFTLPTPTRSGYTFLGWSTSSTATTATYAAGNSFYLSSNTTLYAVWSANTTTYTVTYNANGGIVSPPTASAVSGNSVILPTPTRSGYTCLGWSTSKTATSASYACGSAYKPTANVVLYAVWKVKSTPIVNGVTVTEKANLRYKESVTINANINADAGANYTVEWSSSNTKVATVDASGKVTGTKKFGTGTATITCVVTDKNTGKSVSDDCEVTVNFVWWQWIIGIVLFGWIWY